MFHIEFTSEALDDLRMLRKFDQQQILAVDDFDEEIAQTRRSDKLMALLDQRAKQTKTVPLDDVKRLLGLND